LEDLTDEHAHDDSMVWPLPVDGRSAGRLRQQLEHRSHHLEYTAGRRACPLPRRRVGRSHHHGELHALRRHDYELLPNRHGRRAQRTPGRGAASKLKYYFLSSAQSKETTRTEAQLQQARALLIEVGEKIRRKEFAPNHSYCQRCEFGKRCVNFKPAPIQGKIT
jgi:hypothetical protein